MIVYIACVLTIKSSKTVEKSSNTVKRSRPLPLARRRGKHGARHRGSPPGQPGLGLADSLRDFSTAARLVPCGSRGHAIARQAPRHCGGLPNGCSATVRQTFTSAIRPGIFRVSHACRHHHRVRYRHLHAVPAGGTLCAPTWSLSQLAWCARRSDESDVDLHLEVAPDADDARAPALGMCADRAFPLPAGRSDVLLASWLLSPRWRLRGREAMA